MQGRSLFSILLILWCSACVDRININVGSSSVFPVVVNGFISDQPGPYQIQITKAFDIESKLSIKTPIQAKSVVLSDNIGTTEVLSAVSAGVYQTSPTGIRGTLGRVYKLKVELLDGRIYESTPDTLLVSGTVDSVYYNFKEEKTVDGASKYGFDVFFNSTASPKSNYYLWKFIGTYKYDTNPELYSEPCGEGRCPRPRPCSSYILDNGQLRYIKNCSCCSCWSNLLNPDPIVSDNQFVQGGQFRGIRAMYVPLTQWTFMYKVHAQVNQMSLSRKAFTFWKGVKDQKSANASLFQPVTGKIPGNFAQISGTQAPIEGLFFATSISSRSVFINRSAVPNPSIIPNVSLPFADNCLSLFPNSTLVKPSYWTD